MPSQKKSLHSLGGPKVASQSTLPHQETQTVLNLLRFEGVRKILTLISRKELSEPGKTLRVYWQDHQKKNVSRPMIGVMEQSGKCNFDTRTDPVGEKFSKRLF